MAQRHQAPQNRRPRPDAAHEEEDVFLSKVYEATTWAQRNSQTLIIAGVAVAGLIFAGVVYVNSRANITEQAILQLEQIQQTVTVGDREAAKGQLDNYIVDFGSTPHADEARLLLASLHLESGESEAALEVLSSAEIGLGQPLGVQVGILEGQALEEAGRLSDAEAQYLRVADRAELDFQITGALAAAARVREGSGNLAGAIELYERILASLEETDPDRSYYTMRLAEARESAGV